MELPYEEAKHIAQNAGPDLATDMGILHGAGFKNATDNATRAQTAQMLTNYRRR